MYIDLMEKLKTLKVADSIIDQFIELLAKSDYELTFHNDQLTLRSKYHNQKRPVVYTMLDRTSLMVLSHDLYESSQKNREYRTANGDILIYRGTPPNSGRILTTTLTSKWYTMYTIDPQGLVEKFELDITMIGYIDDKYNPDDLVTWLEDTDMYLCERTLEMMIGRWDLEVTNG